SANTKATPQQRTVSIQRIINKNVTSDIVQELVHHNEEIMDAVERTGVATNKRVVELTDCVKQLQRDLKEATNHSAQTMDDCFEGLTKCK
ncbi:hypothetical protein BG011_002583, partial [Mortierella polycephala]